MGFCIHWKCDSRPFVRSIQINNFGKQPLPDYRKLLTYYININVVFFSNCSLLQPKTDILSGRHFQIAAYNAFQIWWDFQWAISLSDCSRSFVGFILAKGQEYAVNIAKFEENHNEKPKNAAQHILFCQCTKQPTWFEPMTIKWHTHNRNGPKPAP